jgi:quercetin dioxygenase-like cupin family protein
MESAVRIERQQGVAPPETGFTGIVRIANYHRRAAPSRLFGATVSFQAGDRTPWKTNPLGQTIIVLSGRGRIGSDDEIADVKAGDIVWWSPGERHWEGAAPGGAMTCVAVQKEDGASVAFGDPVTDGEYGAR